MKINYIFPVGEDTSSLNMNKPGENPCGPMVHRLKSSCGRESPTRSALALILHWGHCSKFPPVHAFRVGRRLEGRGNVFSSKDWHISDVVELRTGDGSIHLGIHLVSEQISKLVHAQEKAFESLMGKSVVPLNLRFVLHPDLPPNNKRKSTC